MENKNEEFYVIDLARILKSLWHKVWLIALSGLVLAVVGFSIATFVITPKYSSSVMLYVNNSSSSGNQSSGISSSQITAAQSLVKTYSVMLQNRTTLEKVIEKSGVSYSYKQLASMIDAKSANNTEIMKVTVESTDPEEAARIANVICEVLPERISQIIEGASMTVVENAVENYEKVSPNVTMYTVLAFVLGILFSAAAITVKTVLDDRIYDEDYVLKNYDCPVLAKIPDLVNSKGKQYGYYYQSEQEEIK